MMSTLAVCGKDTKKAWGIVGKTRFWRLLRSFHGLYAMWKVELEEDEVGGIGEVRGVGSILAKTEECAKCGLEDVGR